MAKRFMQSTDAPREKALLVGVGFHGQKNILSREDSLNELRQLCLTAGLEVVGELTQTLDHPNAHTFIGSGKVEELRSFAEESLADIIMFDNELSPRHQRELEEALGRHVRVMDRTALILDIFAQHAHTNEGFLQVKLAQYEYYLPRLTGRWTHLARQTGGGGGRTGSVGGVGLRGPGETQLEVDRRTIRREIIHLKDELEKVRMQRKNRHSQRKRTRFPLITLVGYTNAGKSTLLNRLAKTEVLVADQLFATLDPTTRRVCLGGNEIVLMTDTVGFIQKLPTTLISAFRATLEEISLSDLLIHVVDISHPNALNQAEAVESTLIEINADHIPVVTALNKTDRLKNPDFARRTTEIFPCSVAVSALTGQGIDDLVALLRKLLFETYSPITVQIPYTRGQFIALFHEFGQIDQISHGQAHVTIRGRLPGRLLAQFSDWVYTPNVKLNKDAIND